MERRASVTRTPGVLTEDARVDRRGAGRLERGDLVLVLERQADVVEAVQQAVPVERVELEGIAVRGAIVCASRSTVSSAPEPAPSAACTCSAGSATVSSPILSEFARKMSPNDGAMIDLEAVVLRAPRRRARATSRSRSCGRRARIVAPCVLGPVQLEGGILRASRRRGTRRSPVRSIRFRNCFGMIWSVSTSARSSTATRPGRCRRNGLHAHRLQRELAHVDEVAGDRGRRRHRRADEMRPPAARPGGPRSCGSTSRRSARPAASTSGFMPRHIEQPAWRHSKPAASKTAVEPLLLGLALDRRPSPGTTIARTRRVDAPAGDDRRRGAQVLDPRVRARADEDAVDRDLLRSAFPARAPCRRARARRPRARPGRRSRRDRARRRRPATTMPGFVPQVTCGASSRDVDLDLAVERRRPSSEGSARQRRAPAPTRRRCGAPGRPSRYANVVSSGAIIPARAPASIDMLQIVIRPSIEQRRGRPAPAYSITWPTPPATPIWPIAPRITSFAVTPSGSSPSKRTRIVFGLRCGSVCVASTCSTSEVPMPKASAPKAPCVDVWLSPQTIVIPGCVSAELRADHVDDPLAPAAGRVERDAELLAVPPQRLELRARERVRRSVRRPSGRCGPSSRASGRAGAPAGPRAAAPRTPAARSPRGRGGGRRRGAPARPRRSRTTCASQTRSKSVLPILVLWRIACGLRARQRSAGTQCARGPSVSATTSSTLRTAASPDQSPSAQVATRRARRTRHAVNPATDAPAVA